MNYNNKPLKLEELRQMDGCPVWGVSLINEKPGEWFIVRIVEMRQYWFIACAGASQGFGDKDTYGKTWLAYAQKPINFDKWEPCCYCDEQSCGICSYLSTPKNMFPCKDCDSYSCYDPFQFCPECGRPLTNEAKQMLENRLRG